LRVAEQILTGDMVVVADLGAAHAAEKFPAQFVQAPSSE
jgi:hypothetical protein